MPAAKVIVYAPAEPPVETEGHSPVMPHPAPPIAMTARRVLTVPAT